MYAVPAALAALIALALFLPSGARAQYAHWVLGEVDGTEISYEYGNSGGNLVIKVSGVSGNNGNMLAQFVLFLGWTGDSTTLLLNNGDDMFNPESESGDICITFRRAAKGEHLPLVLNGRSEELFESAKAVVHRLSKSEAFWDFISQEERFADASQKGAIRKELHGFLNGEYFPAVVTWN